MKNLPRIVSITLAAMFAGFVTLQFNDVDAWLWVLAYGVASVLCLCNLSKRLDRVVNRMSALLGFAYALWAIALFRQTSGRWWDGEIEREVGGLAITALAMLMLNYFTRRVSRF
ncbi:MAG: hypothetical protein FGM32_01825 [Candidatus Kapabacteria bacterium]|nr:hypothetical protein [Candidatus Kapabacteria bacterium]